MYRLVMGSPASWLNFNSAQVSAFCHYLRNIKEQMAILMTTRECAMYDNDMVSSLLYIEWVRVKLRRIALRIQGHIAVTLAKYLNFFAIFRHHQI